MWRRWRTESWSCPKNHVSFAELPSASFRCWYLQRGGLLRHEVAGRDGEVERGAENGWVDVLRCQGVVGEKTVVGGSSFSAVAGNADVAARHGAAAVCRLRHHSDETSVAWVNWTFGGRGPLHMNDDYLHAYGAGDDVIQQGKSHPVPQGDRGCLQSDQRTA